MNYQRLLIDIKYKTSNVARYVQGISVKEVKFINVKKNPMIKLDSFSFSTKCII